MTREYHYRWEWTFPVTPQQLWPYVADTDRFNQDTALPPIEEVEVGTLANGRRHLRFRLPIVNISWYEEPFQWNYPHSFQVVRHYNTSPLKQMRVHVSLIPLDNGHTQLVYEVDAVPRNILGRMGIPIVIGWVSHYQFDKVFRQYAELAQKSALPIKETRASFVAGGKARLDAVRQPLVADGFSAELVDKLLHLIERGDDITLLRLRPFTFATHWGASRRQVLSLFLHATRLGILDLQWDVRCPACRGQAEAHTHLSEVESDSYCPSCHLDFEVNLDHSIELTFTPSPSIRPIDTALFCVAGPERTPHVFSKQLLQEGETRSIQLLLEEGGYRILMPQPNKEVLIEVTQFGVNEETVELGGDTPILDMLSTMPTLHLKNNSSEEQLVMLEQTAWSADAVRAAHVTAMQEFRDLFANEALRPGQEISVGSLTILFTDLKDSTRLYREIGDAPAFGLVMDHFDILREAIATEEGAIVKTIGDAVMGVFQQPVAAIKAILAAQSALRTAGEGKRPLSLKAAIHHGPSIAVNLNDRLDYFGSTVNMAARLEKFSQGNDLILSDVVYKDPEVQTLLQEQATNFIVEGFTKPLKGFDNQTFELWCIRAKES